MTASESGLSLCWGLLRARCAVGQRPCALGRGPGRWPGPEGLRLRGSCRLGWAGRVDAVLGTERAPPVGLESGFFPYLSLSSLLTDESRLSTSLSLS